MKRIISVRGKRHVERDRGRQRGCHLCPQRALGEAPLPPPTLPQGSYSRISQEEVGPDLVDVAQCGGPPGPQQALQRGQRRRLVGGHWACPVDLGPPEVLLSQGVHPRTGWTPQWLQACSWKVGLPDPEASSGAEPRWQWDEAGRASASLYEVINQLSCGRGLDPFPRNSRSLVTLSPAFSRGP